MGETHFSVCAWPGFSHQQAAVRSRHPALQADGGKVCSASAGTHYQHFKKILSSFSCPGNWWWCLLQVLFRHQADDLRQRPGDELGSGRTVQGRCRRTFAFRSLETQRAATHVACCVFQNYSGELNYLVALHELYKYINKYYDQVKVTFSFSDIILQDM